MISKKILIITSSNFPPVGTGTGIIMNRIFKYFNKNSFCILMGNPFKIGRPVDVNLKLKCKYYYCPSPKEGGKGANTRFNRVSEYLYILLVIIKGYWICRREKIDHILAVPWRSFEIAAYVLHKLLKIQLSVYLFDLYSAHGRMGRFRDYIMKKFEKFFIKSSSATFVMSESLKDLYMKRYDIETIYIPHPVEINNYNIKNKYNQFPQKEINIVFTGQINSGQSILIKNLCVAIKGIHNFFIKLKIFTTGDIKSHRTNLHIFNSFIEVSYAPPQAIIKIQKEADILYLPMAFEQLPPEIIRTASPGKMSEYLAVGKPILVHAPGYSYVSNYAKREGWGYVVNEPGSLGLRKAILQLITEEELRVKLVNNSLKTAMKHDAEKVSKTVQKYIGVGF